MALGQVLEDFVPVEEEPKVTNQVLSDFVPVEEKKGTVDFSAPLEDFEPVASPGIAKSVAQGALDLGGGLIAAGTRLVGGTMENVGDLTGLDSVSEAGTAFKEKGKQVQKNASEVVITPQERENMDLIDRTSAQIAGVLPLFALGPIGGAVVGAASSTINTYGQAKDAGEETMDAMQMAAYQGAATMVAMRLPAFGKTVSGTAGLAIAGGPVAGAGADFLTSMVAETDAGKSPYVMFDANGNLNKDYFATRLTETVVGGVAGTIGYRNWRANLPTQKLTDQWAKMTQQERETFFVNEGVTADLFTGINNWQSARQPNETWKAAADRFFQKDSTFQSLADVLAGVSKGDIHETHGNVMQTLELIVRTSTDAEQRGYANFLLHRGIVDGLNWHNVFVTDNNHPLGGRTSLTPSHGFTKITINEAYKNTFEQDPQNPALHVQKPDKTNFYGVLLHEIGHARTAWMTHKLRNSKPEVIKDFEDKFLETARQKMREKFMTPDTKTVEGSRLYGLKNLDEFLAEFPNAEINRDASIPTEVMGAAQTITRHLKTDLADVFLTRKEADALLPKDYEYPEMNSITRQFFNFMRVSETQDMISLKDLGALWYDHLARQTRLEDNVPYGAFERNGQMHANTLNPLHQQMTDRKDFAQDRLKERVTGQDGPDSKLFWRQVWYNLRHADTLDEFVVSMVNIDPNNAALAKWTKEKSRALWERKDWYAETLRDSLATIKDLPGDKKKLGYDDRTVDEFFKDEDQTAIRDFKLNGFARMFLNPLTIRLLASQDGGLGGRLVKYGLDQMARYAHEGDKIYHQLKTQDAKEYYKLAKKDQARVMDIAAHYDSLAGRRELMLHKINWPDENMLRAQGLTPEQIAGYQGLARATDNAFNVLNMLSMKLTGKTIPRIPGYMPHYHLGPYKVHVMDQIGTNPDGSAVTRVVLVRGFKTRMYANKFATEMMRQGLDIAPDPRTGDNIRVFRWDDVGNGLLQNFKDHLDAHLNLMDADKNGIALKTQQAEDMAYAHWDKHMQTRDDVRGFEGEFGGTGGVNPYDGTWTRMKAKLFGESNALHIYDKYFKDVAESYRNVMFMENVYAPLMGLQTKLVDTQARHGKKVLPLDNTYKILEQHGKNFLGKNLNHLEWVDNSLRSVMVTAGLDPNLARHFVRATRNALATIKLRVNPANWMANYLQKVHTVAMIQYMETVSGGDSSGALKSFIKMNSKDSDKLDKVYYDALEKARVNHIVDPLLDMEIRGENRGLFSDVPILGAIQKGWDRTGEVNAMVERHGREKSFLTAFDFYLNKGMNEHQAYEAARLIMGMTMVNYDRASRPLMYQNLGMTGEAMAPFAVFRNAFLGNMYLMVKTLANHPNKLEAAKPLMTTMATFMALAGASGIPLAGEYDMLINAINYMFPGELDLPTLEVAMLKGNVPDILTYGAPSQIFKLFGFGNGINFSPSMGAVNIDDAGSFAILPFWKAISQVVGLTAQAGLSQIPGSGIYPPSVTDFYEPTRKLTPNVLHPVVEGFMTDWDMGRGLKSTSVEGLTKRTPEDIISLVLSGKHSIAERKERAVEREIDRVTAKNKKRMTHLVKLHADLIEGLPTALNQEDLMKRVRQLLKETGTDPSGYEKRVAAEIARRRLDKHTKRALSKSTSAQVQHKMRQELLFPSGVPAPEEQE
jgi:hypothetical protein